MVTNTLIQNEDEIYQKLEDKLKSFMSKWPLFYNAISVELSAAEQLYRNDLYSLTLKGHDKIHNVPFRLNVNVLSQRGSCENIFLRLNLAPKSLLLFANDTFSPDEMYTSFWTMACMLFNLELPNDSRSDISFSFDDTHNIEEIYLMVKNTNPAINTLAFAHRIYEHNDAYFLEFLRANNITNLKNLRNFYFIWQRTNIREILIPDNFEESFFLYITEIERYHDLIQMERI
jgi:hypothetical protein